MTITVLAPDGSAYLWPDGSTILWPDGTINTPGASVNADVSGYTNLVTSEHASRPNFIALLSELVQAFADVQVVMSAMPTLYDLDVAIGVQLDTIGLWVGRSRFLSEPLTNVYFSLDTDGLGFDQGSWLGPFDPTTGMVSLPDEAYRTLLRAVIVANQWDGTIPQAYTAWQALFSSQSYGILIQDGQDMSMIFALTGPSPDAVTLALFTSGYLSVKPAGVHVSYVTQTVPNNAYFGLDVENNSISGFDVGAWGHFGT